MSTFDGHAWPSGRPRSDKGYQRIEAPKDYEHRLIPIPGFLLEPLRMQIAGRQLQDPVLFDARTRTWLRNHTFRKR